MRVLPIAIFAGVALAGPALAQTAMQAVKPGLMCTSAGALAKLTMPDGSSRVGSPSQKPEDAALKASGGCIDIPQGATVSASSVRKQTSIVSFDPGDGRGARTFIVPNIDFAAAGAQSAASSAGRPAKMAGCLPVDPATVALNGRVGVAVGYGPPGFGEDPKVDKRFTYASLGLDHPICLQADTPGAAAGQQAIRDIELFWPDHGRVFDGRPWLGKHVAMAGKLEVPVSASQSATDVYVDVDTIR